MSVFSRSSFAIDGTIAVGSGALRLTASTAATTCGSGGAAQRFVGSVWPWAATSGLTYARVEADASAASDAWNARIGTRIATQEAAIETGTIAAVRQPRKQRA